jgi:hypothetical protein
MATSKLTSELRPANEAIALSRDAGSLLTLIVLGLVLANVLVLAAAIASS